MRILSPLMSRGMDLRTIRVGAAARTRMLVIAVALVATCATAVAIASASNRRAASAPGITINVGKTALGPSIAPGFVGLATEYWNVEAEVGTDPNKPDATFEQVIRNLAPNGGFSLRIGGDSTDWTWYPIPGLKTPPWVRWTMTPTWAAVTKRLVDDLHAHLIVGLNMEASSARIAVGELHEIQRGIGGSAPITYELGNEPELYDHFPYYHAANGAAVLGRPKTYTLTQMAAEWDQLADALPAVRLAGPGYSGLSALPYVAQFLGTTKKLKLLTVHTYPLKSKRCDPAAQLQESQLFDSQSLAGLAAGVSSWTSLARHYGVGVRVDEINSVTCGGQPGFTSTFGPALWALNILPLYAADGVNGVNFQTRPYTAQNLIQPHYTTAGWRVAVQPEYYGLLAFAQLTPPGSRILQVSQTKSGPLTWAVRTPQGQTHVVVTNVGSSTIKVAIKAGHAPSTASVESLTAPGGLGATKGVTLGGQAIDQYTGNLAGTPVTKTVHSAHGAYDLTVPAASAEILTFRS